MGLRRLDVRRLQHDRRCEHRWIDDGRLGENFEKVPAARVEHVELAAPRLDLLHAHDIGIGVDLQVVLDADRGQHEAELAGELAPERLDLVVGPHQTVGDPLPACTETSLVGGLLLQAGQFLFLALVEPLVAVRAATVTAPSRT